jgi:hypothetical protein
MNNHPISYQTVIQRRIPPLRQNNITIQAVTFQCNFSDVITYLYEFSVSDDATMTP